MKEMNFEVFLKKERSQIEARENTGELRLGWEEVEWDDKYGVSQKTVPQSRSNKIWKDLFVILRPEWLD